MVPSATLRSVSWSSHSGNENASTVSDATETLALVLVHLDTDIGGDPDDVCALAMLLGWPDVEILGITTTHEEAGRRAGFVHEVLRLAGHPDCSVAAGAEHSITTLVQPGGFPDDTRYWGHPIEAVPSPAGAAFDLIAAQHSSAAPP